MHIVVCIKQVPDSTQIRVHPVTNTIMRQGVPTVVNPYDLFSLEEALRLRDKHGGEVTVVTMGPPMADQSLRKCLTVWSQSCGPSDGSFLCWFRYACDLICSGLFD
jgi:electron transfer flavoprotein beta subunit